MSQQINLPFSAWEGLNRIKDISEVVASLRPGIKIPSGHPRTIKIKNLLLCGEEEELHQEIKYWFPTQGTVEIGLIGYRDEHGLFLTTTHLKARWKDSSKKNNTFSIYFRIEIFERLAVARRNFKNGNCCKTDLLKVEKRAEETMVELLDPW